MYRLTNIVDDTALLRPYGSPQEMRAWLSALSLDGFEAIRGYENGSSLEKGLAVGYHLLFYSDWVDFYRQRRSALLEKFGTKAAWESYYGTSSPEGLVEKFRADMDHAESIGAKYAVFHVSDVSVQEGYDYRFRHTDEEVTEASVELLNAAMRGRDYHFELLLENLWWPGFTFTRPEIIKMLFEGIEYKNTGIMLDTGHLLNTNTDLQNGAEAVRYIHEMLDRNSAYIERIRGIHLHASLSGTYVKECLKAPKRAEGEFFTQFAEAYGHVLTIDTHEPFLFEGVKGLAARIAPEYLVYEFAAQDPRQKAQKIREQNRALDIG